MANVFENCRTFKDLRVEYAKKQYECKTVESLGIIDRDFDDKWKQLRQEETERRMAIAVQLDSAEDDIRKKLSPWGKRETITTDDRLDQIAFALGRIADMLTQLNMNIVEFADENGGEK